MVYGYKQIVGTITTTATTKGAGIAQMVERPIEKPGETGSDASSNPRRGKGFFSQS